MSGGGPGWLLGVDAGNTKTIALVAAADGTIHGSGWAHFAVTFAIWVVVPLVAGMLRLRRHELK